MLFFCERSPIVFGSQVEDNMFATTKVCKKEKLKKGEEEKSLTAEHNEDVFNINFECAGKQENKPIIVTNEREYEEKDTGKDTKFYKDKEESIETIFQQWSQ